MRKLPVRSLCDRCGFTYFRAQLRKEPHGTVVCKACYDGRYDIRAHPQNFPAGTRRESLPVPDGRAPIDLTDYLAQETSEFILQESGGPIIVSGPIWTPSQTA